MSNKKSPIAATPPNRSTEFSRDLLLRDGAVLRVRSMRHDDRQALKDLFARCSPQSIRFRFLHQVKELTEDMLDRLTAIDGARHIALVVTHGAPSASASKKIGGEIGGDIKDDIGGNERIVAVGRYQAGDDRPDVAEVSFLVEDAMQRRGIGTLLLDALAELARERGVTRFSADVLADNRQMLSVFRKAGYALSATISYGVTELEFPIALTELAQTRAEAQEAEAERVSLAHVLAPKSVAVIGASRDPKSVGGALFQNLIQWRFAGVVYPVNPSAKSVAGVRAYASISEAPEVPELAFIAVPACGVLDAARQCAAAGVRALCVISAGFAETGAEGKAMQDELLGICRSSGMRLVGPNCLGLVTAAPRDGADVRMLGTFAPANPPSGNIAISSQSGALGLTLLNQLSKFGLGVSSFVSIGNRADVSGNDLLQYWEADDSTDVILLYLESFGNPRRFARIARRVARGKPIVAVKSGRTPGGARAASSHTAALASLDRAADALFAQTGIIRVDTLMEFFSVARLLASQPIPAGNRIGILTNAGGPAILAVDAAESAGLKVPQLSESTKERLRQTLPATAAINNPVDMVANAGPEHYRACLEALFDEPNLDAILVIFIPPLVTPSAEVARVISEVVVARAEQHRSDAARPIAAVFLDPQAKLSVIHAGDRVVPVYDFPEGAIAAISAAARYGSWRAKPAGHFAQIPIDRDAIDRVLATNEAGWLSQDDVGALLGAVGIQLAPARVAHSADEAAAAAAAFNHPVAMKIIEPAVLHKTDVEGIVLNIPPAEAAAGYDRLAAQLAAHGVRMTAATVAPMAPSGVEVLAGVTNDPVFGPLVAFGSGGVLVELLDDVVFRVLPLTDRDVTEMIQGTRVWRLLQGYRGSAPADIAALEQLLLALGTLAESAQRIAEIDLNPVIVHPVGEGISLIDARVRLSE